MSSMNPCTEMRPRFRLAVALAPLAAMFFVPLAFAQGTAPAQGLASGDAVVTGYSGARAPDPARPLPVGKTAIDRTFINPDGVSAQVLDLTQPGRGYDASVLDAPRRLRVTAGQVGQVFGVAIGDAPRPGAAVNVYLAATSLYGLQIVHRTAAGAIERLKAGAPGARWADGQFGVAMQGGPGAIYVVDGATGVPALLTNVALDGVPNPGPGLGNLAYDSGHRQLFVSDLYTGMIHRIGLDGADLGHFDHGVSGRAAAGLPQVAFDPARRLNIASPAFDAQRPATWGLAPPDRRVFAVTLAQGRLYYSVGAQQQIWSVAIAQDGAFGADPRLEVELPAAIASIPVADIAFSSAGAMVLAQRSPPGSGFYDYSAFTAPGEARVLRFLPRSPNDPPAPGVWRLEPQDIPVGFAGTFRNANGGVAFGYGYDPSGRLDIGACGAALLVTGERLRNNPGLRERLTPGGPLPVDGIQIGPSDATLDPNAPAGPWQSYFVDYDGAFVESAAQGHLGSVRTFTTPCPPMTLASGGARAPALIDGRPLGGPTSSSGGGGNEGCSGPNCGGPACVGPNCAPCAYGMNPDGSCVTPPIPVDLAIKKTGATSPAPQVNGYSFTLAISNNSAPFVAPSGAITITDVVPSGMTFNAAAGSPGWTCGPPPPPALVGGSTLTCTYAGGAIPTGAMGTITITAMANGPPLYPPFTNCASVGIAALSGYQDANPTNNRDCVTVTKPPPPPNNVTVAKSGPSSCNVEAACTFTITVTNNSPWPFNGPVVLGDNSSIPMNIASTDLPCSPQPTTLPFSCTANISLPAGVSSQTFTITAVIAAGSIPLTTQSASNCASIASGPPISNFPSTITTPTQDCKNYQACGFACHMTQTQIDQIKIEKQANAAQCSPGGLCSYTFTITNLSTTNATSTFPITFVDTMPPGASTYMPPPVPAPWSCLPLGGSADQIKCLYPPGSIPPGGSLSVTITFQISPSYKQPTLQNCSAFFIGQTASAAVQRRAAVAMEGAVLRDYLQSRGLAAMPAQTPAPSLHPDDQSCTTVNIAQEAPAQIRAPVVTPPVITPPVIPPPNACPPGTVRRGAECVATEARCTPPMAPGAVPGQCVCPAGTRASEGKCMPALVCRPPMRANGAGTACVCPDGFTQRGGVCARILVCRAPLILNDRGSACVCPEGTIQRGGRCIRPAVCQPPARPTANGACQCPPGYAARGNACVQRERPKPRPPRGVDQNDRGFTPRDVIRVLPSIIDVMPRGGSSGGPAGGGGQRGR